MDTIITTVSKAPNRWNSPNIVGILSRLPDNEKK